MVVLTEIEELEVPSMHIFGQDVSPVKLCLFSGCELNVFWPYFRIDSMFC